MVEKKQLEKIPGFSQGVRRNAAARMIKMIRPICPNSKQDMIQTPEGKFIPNPQTDPSKQNCQMDRDENGNSRIGWWNDCAERGHDPYFTTRVWYAKSDIYEEVDGEQVKTGERTVRKETKYPNIAQVAAHQRVNSGKGPIVKMTASGFKRLKDFGFEEVCQFRNCQKPVTVTSTVGEYCGKEHAQLCAADYFGVIDYQVPDDPKFFEDIQSQVNRKSRQFLTEASEVAEVRHLG